MAKKIRRFGGLDFVRDNYAYSENRIDWEARKARKAGFLVRRVKRSQYKSGTGNWWSLYTRRKK